MITRTFTLTLANCMTVKGETVTTVSVKLSGKLSEHDAEKAIRKNPALVDGIFVRVNSVTYEDKLYGMDETDFLKYAKELDEKRKPIVG